MKLLSLVLALLLVLAGCGTAPQLANPTRSNAIDAGPESLLGRLGERMVAGGLPGESALHLLPSGMDAMAARLALVDSAERGIDLQYYIFRADASGIGLMDALWRAAESGVRVRLLLDDWGTHPDDATLQRLAAHPRIEIRMFNPLACPRSMVLSLLLSFQQTQRRMHNKLIVADGRAAIVGGRNIGDEYFSRRQEFEFGDVDLLAFGPVVPQVAAAFDRYWNDELSAPVKPGVSVPPASAKVPDQPVTPRRTGPDARWLKRLPAVEGRGFHGLATAVHDLPGKLDPARPDEDSTLGHEIAQVMGPVRDTLLIVSPYFVPGDGGVAQLRDMTRRGVRVTVVTNTLAATDVPAVHAGYARYRAALIDAGVALYELRADALGRARQGRTGSSRLSLHAKLLVVDRTTSFIGSMNIDPRSLQLNTENGVVVNSPVMAAELADGVQRALVDDAWQVHRSGRGLQWRGWQDGAAVTLDHEPGAGLWLRLQTLVLSWLPIESLL